ncbi:long-chain fatty acid--CoA ligase [Rubrivivax gelatinosus]|nr:long-chain fatty acid--CoA ligase [Rubrivivax gelatinosus]
MTATLPSLLAERAATSPSATAYLQRDGAGRWLPLTWQEFADQVDRLSRALTAAGLRRGDRLALIAPVSLKWELLHHAALAVGAAVVGLDAHDLPRRIADMAEQSDVTAFVVADPAVLSGLDERRLASARFVLLLEPAGQVPASIAERALNWDTLLAATTAAATAEAQIAPVAPEDIATIIFTSGTTGQPRGIAYTHGQVCLAVDEICATFSFIGDTSRLLCWLPLSNLFQRIVNLAATKQGAATYLLSDPRQVMQAVSEVAPDIFVGVPRFFEKLLEGVRAGIKSQPPLRRWIAERSWALGRQFSEHKLRGTQPTLTLRLLHGLADRWVLRQIRSVMGHRLRLMVTGSAPIGAQSLHEFHALGWLVLEAYGLSENIVPIAMNRPDDFCFGTVGRPVASNEVVLAEDGAVKVRGPGLFRGYVGGTGPGPFDAEGFYTTGDLGAWDTKGHLRLIGRSGDLFKTSTGRRIAPAHVEATLRQLPGVDQALVVGAGRKYPVALLTVGGRLGQEARDRLDRALERCRSELAEHECPRGVVLLERPFGIEQGELTPNLKLRRAAIEALHAPAIDALYERLDARPLSDRSILIR